MTTPVSRSHQNGTILHLVPASDSSRERESVGGTDSEKRPNRILLTTEEVATILDVDPSTLRRWRTARPVQGPPFIPISGRVTKYRMSDIEMWLDGRVVIPGAA